MKATEETILGNLSAMQRSRFLDDWHYWNRSLRDGLRNRHRSHPASTTGRMARQWVRHCVKQIRILEAQSWD